MEPLLFFPTDEKNHEF